MTVLNYELFSYFRIYMYHRAIRRGKLSVKSNHVMIGILSCYFREFRESDPRENLHFILCIFIAMKTSEKSRITAPSPKSRK